MKSGRLDGSPGGYYRRDDRSAPLAKDQQSRLDST
jgi:hypothetical protein